MIGTAGDINAPASLTLCVRAAPSAIERICPSAQSILIVPEGHTRNLFYLESLATLHKLSANAGYAVRIGSLRPAISAATYFDLPSGRRLTLEPLVRTGARLGVADFDACLIPLDDDLCDDCSAVPGALEQPVRPPRIRLDKTARKRPFRSLSPRGQGIL